MKINLEHLIRKIKRLVIRILYGRRALFSSAQYWEERYKSGGNSGSGSYTNLAKFKAKILNGFVSSHAIKSVIEFGCGDGNQLQLATYERYIGLDVSLTAVELCSDKFKSDHSKEFFLYSSDSNQLFRAELALSLDVIYHLTEEKVFHNYMIDLFGSAEKFVIIYSSDFESQTITHVKHRKFTMWIAKNQPKWRLIERIPNEFPFDESNPDGTSYSDFFIYEKY